MADRRNPTFGSTDWAANQFLRILEREEREKRQQAQRDLATSRLPHAPPNRRLASVSHEEPPNTLKTGSEPTRLPILESQTGLPVKPRIGTLQDSPTDAEYETGRPAGLLDLLIAGGFGEQEELEEYGAVRAATSEAVASQLPGREHGPADAYRHIVWAAELTRRFGERRARELLHLHEVHGQRTDQRDDEGAMDRHNNEIGIRIGNGSGTFDEVIAASRKVIDGSHADGSGQWKVNYQAMKATSPDGATWLDESRWNKNPQIQLPSPKVPSRAPYPRMRELPNSQTNWYANPDRPNGPDWAAGIVPEPYQYPYSTLGDRTGPNDPSILRAINLYRSYINRPWLLWAGEQY